MQIGLIKVDYGQVFIVKWGIWSGVKVANGALECVEIVEVFICELIWLLQLLPEPARCLLQVRKLSVSVDAESRRVSWNIWEIGDVTRIEVQMLDKDWLHDLLCLLDLKKELGVTINVVEDLSTQVLSQIVK